jgi:agmatine/peptidylarginine deiminase
MKFAANMDNQLTRQLYENGIFGAKTGYKNCLSFVLEGGSIESDGKGTLLTTAECLLSANRNNLSKQDVESKLKSYFNLKQVLWLHHGYLAGDDTDSHVDTLARLCNDHTIAYVKCSDPSDEHYVELMKMEDELKAFRMLDGRPYTLIPLPMADVVMDGDDRLPATYANFLIINGAVLMPTYNVPAKDREAADQLQKAFPNRKIVQVDCSALIKQHGSLHCVTMQYSRQVNL